MPRQKKIQMDDETKKVVSEGERIENWVKSDDWKFIKKKLFNKLINVDSLNALPGDLSNEEFLREAAARKGAISLVLDWIREVEGRASQSAANRESEMQIIREESIVEFFPESN